MLEICLVSYGIRGCISYHQCYARAERLGSRGLKVDADLGISGPSNANLRRLFSFATTTMSRLSNSLKALINAPAARPSTVPAPANISAVYSKIAQTAQAKNVSQPSWLALSVCRRNPNPRRETLANGLLDSSNNDHELPRVPRRLIPASLPHIPRRDRRTHARSRSQMH